MPVEFWFLPVTAGIRERGVRSPPRADRRRHRSRPRQCGTGRSDVGIPCGSGSRRTGAVRSITHPSARAWQRLDRPCANLSRGNGAGGYPQDAAAPADLATPRIRIHGRGQRASVRRCPVGRAPRGSPPGGAVDGSTHARRVDACIWQTDPGLARHAEQKRREPEARK